MEHAKDDATCCNTFPEKKFFHHFDRVDQSSFPTFFARLFLQIRIFFTNCNRYLVRVKWTLRITMQKKLGSQVNAITSYRLEKVIKHFDKKVKK